MAGCCVVILAPIMLTLAAVIVVLIAGLLFGGATFVLIGCITRIKLKNTKYSFISNICLTTGMICLLTVLSIEQPLVSGAISLILGLWLIKKYDEWKLLFYYIPVMVAIIILAIPQMQLVEESFILTLLISAVLFIGFVLGIIWLVSQGRKYKEKPILIKEGYSLMFFLSATVSLLIFATMQYMGSAPAIG